MQHNNIEVVFLVDGSDSFDRTKIEGSNVVELGGVKARLNRKINRKFEKKSDFRTKNWISKGMKIITKRFLVDRKP